MTFDELNSIQVELVSPHTIQFPTRIHPIPENKNGVNVPIKFYVSINNTNQEYFNLNSLQGFIPELLTSDGQIVQGHLVTNEIITNKLENNYNQQSNWRRIIPNCRSTFILTASLFWQDNSLQLKIPTIPDSVPSSVNSGYFWHFDALEAKTYQLRFILNTEVQISSGILATPWVNLRLVQTLLSDSTAIEVDKVLFKTEMPSVLTIPSRLFRTKTNVKIGIHVTNQTSTPIKFNQSHSIDVTLINEEGKEIDWLSDMVRPGLGKEPQYYLVQPGESAFFDLEGMLSWYRCQLELAISNKARGFTACGFYYFPNLKRGVYQLQVTYRRPVSRARRPEENVLEKVWRGCVAMPFVQFRIV